MHLAHPYLGLSFGSCVANAAGSVLLDFPFDFLTSSPTGTVDIRSVPLRTALFGVILLSNRNLTDTGGPTSVSAKLVVTS